MSLEIKKGTSPGVNDFLIKRGALIKHLVLHEGSVDPQLAENVTGKLVNLQSVTVDGNVRDRDVVSDEDIVTLQRMCSAVSLSKLSLSHLNNVSMPVVHKFIANFNSLTNLTLNYCSNFNDVSLSNVASSCRNLKVISLRCTMIGDEGLSNLSSYCSSLLSADFGECREITDVGVEYVASRNKDLEEIKVDRCPGVTETALIALAKDCRNLTTCNFEGTGIRKLPSAVVCLSKLRQLKLLGCKQLTHPCAADSEIVQLAYTPKGFQQLLNYFLDYQLTYRIKVFVVGEAGVGKSSLIKCLTFDNPLLVPQGGNGFSGVSLWDPSSVMSNNGLPSGKFILEIWELPSDIVGLGDIFFIEPAIYIVCYDLVEGGVDSVIRNVLSVLSKFPNACILVVGTRADALSQDDVLASIKNVEEKLHQLSASRASAAQKFAGDMANGFTSESPTPLFQRHITVLNSLLDEINTQSFVHAVSCRSRVGINELRQNLLRRCSECAAFFPQLSHNLTPALVQLYEDIRQLRLRSVVVLPWAEFAYFSERAGIPPQDVECETAFFHNAGVIFDFRYLINTSACSSTECYICIDPSRFLELFNCLYSPSLSLPDENMSSILERGHILGRMLPSLWKLSDTDQLELIETLARQLGLMCSNTAALPPASFDKAFPPLPLGAHRCAFIRRVYSLPLLYLRLPKLHRPIHFSPELALDDVQLSLSFRLPEEIISILQSSFQRILAAIPSLFSSRCKKELMLSDFDLSRDLMLLRFSLDKLGDDPVEVLMAVSTSSGDDGITVSARINRTELNSDLSKVSLVLWFYCISVARVVYSQLNYLFSGVPIAIYISCNRCPEESLSLSLSEMFNAWQKNKSPDQTVLQYPPVCRPTSSDFESLADMFEYLAGKLRASLVNCSLQVCTKSPAFHQPNPSKSFVGDGIIVNDGCFRRGKSRKLNVQFLDDWHFYVRSVSMSSADSSAAAPNFYYQPFWSPSLSSRSNNSPGIIANQTMPMSWRPGASMFQPNFYGRGGNTFCMTEAPGENSVAENDIAIAAAATLEGAPMEEEDEDDKITKDSIAGDYNDYTDHLSVLSSNTATLTDANSIDSTMHQRRQLSYKRKRQSSPPPPCRQPVSSPTEPMFVSSVCLAKAEESVDEVDEVAVCHIVETVQQATLVIHNSAPLSENFVSAANLNSPITVTEPPLMKSSAKPVGNNIAEKVVGETLRRLPDTPLNEGLTVETKSSTTGGSSNTVNMKTETVRSSAASTRSTPSVGEDSGLVGFEDVESDEHEKQSSPENLVATANDKPCNVENPAIVTAQTIPQVSLCSNEGPANNNNSVADLKSPIPNLKHNKLKLPAFASLRRQKSDTADRRPCEVSTSAVPNADLVNGNVAKLVNRHRSSSFKNKKDRAKCLCS